MKLASCTMIYLDYTTLEEAIRRIARTGFEGVDVWGDGPQLDVMIDRGDRSDLSKLVADVGLQWSALSVNGGVLARQYNFVYDKPWVRAQTVDYYKKCLDVCAEMGIPRINVISGHMMHDTTFEQAWQWMLDGVAEVADHAAKVGVTPCLHTLTWSESRVVVTLDDIIRLKNELGRDNVKLQIDTADQNITDSNISDAVRRVVKDVDYVHFSDNDGAGVGLTHNIPGEGTMNWKRFVTVLKEGGYAGWLTAQLYAGHPIDPDGWQERCYEYMKDVMQQCGVWED